MGIQQPAGRDYVQSKEYSSKLLNQVSKVREILTGRNSCLLWLESVYYIVQGRFQIKIRTYFTLGFGQF